MPALKLLVRGDPGHPMSTAERLHELLKGSESIVLNDLSELALQRDAIARFVARAPAELYSSAGSALPGSP